MKDKPAVHRRVHIFSSFLFAKLTQRGLTQEERLTDALKFSQTQVMQSSFKSGAGCLHCHSHKHVHKHTGSSRLRKAFLRSAPSLMLLEVSRAWLSFCLGG